MLRLLGPVLTPSLLPLYYSRPRVEWYKRLRVLNTSPPRNCFSPSRRRQRLPSLHKCSWSVRGRTSPPRPLTSTFLRGGTLVHIRLCCPLMLGRYLTHASCVDFGPLKMPTQQCTGVPRSSKNAPPWDLTVGLCIGSYRGPSGVGVFLWARYPCTQNAVELMARGPLGPLGFECSQHRQTLRPSSSRDPQQSPASFRSAVKDLEDPAVQCRWLAVSV